MKNRFLIVLTVVLGLSLSSSQSAAQNRVLGLHETLSNENAEAIADAMATLDEWMAALNNGMIAYMADPAAQDQSMKDWAAWNNYPHVRLANGNVSVWESAEEYAMGRSFEGLARIGWHHGHWLSREVSLASPEKVHVETVFQRWNDRNEMIGEWQSLYMVTLVDGHWGVQARSSLCC